MLDLVFFVYFYYLFIFFILVLLLRFAFNHTTAWRPVITVYNITTPPAPLPAPATPAYPSRRAGRRLPLPPGCRDGRGRTGALLPWPDRLNNCKKTYAVITVKNKKIRDIVSLNFKSIKAGILLTILLFF